VFYGAIQKIKVASFFGLRPTVYVRYDSVHSCTVHISKALDTVAVHGLIKF